jgi:hypothetical protein
VVHEGQRLPLRLEPGEDLGRVHAGLDDLEGDGAANRFRLLGHEDDAHAPLANPLEQLVGPDLPVRRFVVGRMARRGGHGGIAGDVESRRRLSRKLPGASAAASIVSTR